MKIRLTTTEIYPAFVESRLGTLVDLPDELVAEWREISKRFQIVTEKMHTAIHLANDFRLP